MQHLKQLAVEIGTRGSTTAGEKAAAEYAFAQLEASGLEPKWEPFQAPVSGWRPFVIAPAISIVCLLLVQLDAKWGAIVAFFITALLANQILLELYFQPTIFQKLIPKGESQNVWARIRPLKRPKIKLLLVGHLDTHRTPWVFSSPNRLLFFRLLSAGGMIVNLLAPFLILLMLSSEQMGRQGLQAGWFLYLWELRWMLLLLIPVQLMVMAVSWQADRTPFTEGANDNASGASIVLSLAQQLSQTQLDYVEVWTLCTGCEEVGIHGMQAFIRQHKDALTDVMGISIDNVGGKGAGVCFTSKEGMLFTRKAGKQLFSLAMALAEKRPFYNAYSKPYTFLHTDGTCMMFNNIPTLSFVGLTPNGRLPNWHQISDTFEEVDPETVEKTEAFIFELLQTLNTP